MKEVFKKVIVIALTWEARCVLKKYKPRVVAITGSVGKTLTKDAVFAVLASSTFVRKSEKSYNSETGVPLTIIGRPSGWRSPFAWVANLVEGLGLMFLKNHYPTTLVLEVGADRPGDVQRVARWLAPSVTVLTRFPDVPAHIEYFPSVDAVVEEKAALLRSMPAGGTLVFNSDDHRAQQVANEFHGQRIGYGFLPGARFRSADDELLYDANGKLTGMRCRVEEGGTSVPVVVSGIIGRQCLYSALAAIAVGSVNNINVVAAGKALAAIEPTPGRMRLIDGIKEVQIIDDTYNASPAAVEEALLVLKRANVRGRKIAVIADMLELGEHTMEEHKRIGAQAAECVDILLTVGIRARSIAEGALSAGMHESKILQYEEGDRAGKELQNMLSEGDLVLIKGSQKMRMERVVEEIMLHPEEKEKLLVRQESEWKNR